MLRVALVHCLLIGFLGASFTLAEPRKDRDGKDDVMGAIWSYTLTKGDETSHGKFRVYNKEVFKGSEKVGSVDVEDEDQTTITFTKWPEMNGKAVLRKTKRNPPGAAGTLTKTDGSQWEMK